jgi:heterogeneous nuclear ribonucleoprotein A1/A3
VAAILSCSHSLSAERIPEALEQIEEKAQSDPAHRKLFIRGLAWDTTDEQLHSSFSSFGEIEEAAVVMDRTTGKNKGYGFVIFKDMDSAYAALQEPDKEIDVWPSLPFTPSSHWCREGRLTATSHR